MSVPVFAGAFKRARLRGVLLILAASLLGCLALAGTASARSAARSSKPKLSKCQKAGSHGRVLLVGTFNGKAGQCLTLQEAVDAAPPGGWILIAPGDYKETSSRHAPGAYGDDRAPASILVTTPGLHIRGMNRNTVVIDGTKPGSPQCSAAEGDQTFGPETENGPEGNNGIEVYKASGVYLQNLTVCNFLNGSHGGGDALWFDGGGASGKQDIGAWWGEYLNATSTYWGGKSKPSMEYGIYASNTTGPGFFANDFANNSSDSAYYIGACPDCNTTLDNVTAENSDLGYSGSNSGGRLVVKNSLFQNNEEGFATQSQNNDDAPPPQDGICPGGKENASPPTGAQRKNICWEFIDNRVLNNNNGRTPTHQQRPRPRRHRHVDRRRTQRPGDGQHVLGQRGLGHPARALSGRRMNRRRNRFPRKTTAKVASKPKAIASSKRSPTRSTTTRSRTTADSATPRTVTSAKSPTPNRRC